MNTRTKAGLVMLAAIGAVSSIQFISGRALAQQPPPPVGGGGFGGGGFGGGQMRQMANNWTAKVTITQAIETATAKTPGFVNNARLQPIMRRFGQGGPPGGSAGGPPPPSGQAGPPKMIWVVHIVTEPGAGPGSPGKGQDVAVDAVTNQVTEMPPPPRFNGGGGFGGGGQGGPPPPPPGGGGA